ncbi:hypothetical protein Goshw_005958, partial [Gossypium schwendimanii]|nr:hypothetical protein [Gossypium schwendimanii]
KDTSLYEGVGFDDSSVEGLITKKVCFKDKSDRSERESAVDQNTSHSLLKGYGVGNSNSNSRRLVTLFDADAIEDLDLME